jgi:DNA polymerase-4
MNDSYWPTDGTRVVMHIDMDAYFAAVEQKLLPILEGKQVIVGGGPDVRGIVNTASYEARKFGVHSGMALKTAAKLCPDAYYISSGPSAYDYYSRRLYDIFCRFTPKVEPTSVDEAFLDVTGMRRHYATPADLARELKRAVRDELQLTCSVGIAPNKLLAKMASSQNKPDGLYWVDPEHIEEWLEKQPVGNLWGVGKKTEEALAKIGVKTVGDLHRVALGALKRRYGKWGEAMYHMARGNDHSPVLAVQERPREKSIGHEYTYTTDTSDPQMWHATLLALADMVGTRLRRGGFRGKTITLKFRDAGFHTTTHADTLVQATDNEKVIYGTALRLLNELKPQGKTVRLLGISVSNLIHGEEEKQINLFEERNAKRGKASKVLDLLREKFGVEAIDQAGSDELSGRFLGFTRIER